MRTALVALPLAAASLVTPRPAEACGGCFVPPRAVSQVTGHRMVLSISKTQTTLYDQIAYSGEPESFAWVLPTVGKVEVGITSDLLFNALDQPSQVYVQPPPLNCGPAPGAVDSFGSGPGRGPSATSGGGVTVIAQETVGPYETVQLAATDPKALNAWLGQHGYVIPKEIEPVVGAYVGAGFNFLAMKLVPGVGVSKMQPVRVTTAGASPILPLRMVAAGTGVTTLVTLFVMGEGRYEPANYPAFTITADKLVWNWDAAESNYTELRSVAYEASNGFAWLTEASMSFQPYFVSNQLEAAIDYGGGPAAAGYPDLTPEDAKIQAQKDVDLLFAGIASGEARLTRLRGELSREALATDLVLQASDDQAEVSTFLQAVKSVGTPPCPPSSGSGSSGGVDDDDGLFPGGTDGGERDDGLRSGGGGCSVSGRGDGRLLFALLCLVALGACRRPRRI
jgi:hypothetical protein